MRRFGSLPAQLTIWEVVDAVEPLKRIRQCPLGIDAHQGKLCPLHRRMDNVMEMVEKSFRQTTVAELLSEPGSVSPLCAEQNLMTIDLGGNDAEAPQESARRRTRKG